MGTVGATRSPRVVGALPNGTMLGRFEILGLLSVGGMAEIYLARTEGIAGFEKLVVIKRMLPHFAMQAEFVQMFLAEARLGAMLDHPNVVAVHDIGEETGNYYYEMEYVRGADLRQIMKVQHHSGPMPLPCAITIAVGMCAGLDHAHGLTDVRGVPLGVVHRDVSLSNVLVSYDGTVKVTDFGVAKVASSDHLTRTGTIKGKIGYMSPEQCRGETLDRRSDIFAIGIILYELTTGGRLFQAQDSDFAVLERIIKRDVTPPSRLRADYPPALEAIVLRALRRDRDERYQTAREMQRDLEELARTERLPVSASDLAAYVRSQVPPSAPAIDRLPTRAAAPTKTAPPATRTPTELPTEPWGADYEITLGPPEAVHAAAPRRPRRRGIVVVTGAVLLSAAVTLAVVSTTTDAEQYTPVSVAARLEPAAPTPTAPRALAAASMMTTPAPIAPQAPPSPPPEIVAPPTRVETAAARLHERAHPPAHPPVHARVASHEAPAIDAGVELAPAVVAPAPAPEPIAVSPPDAAPAPAPPPSIPVAPPRAAPAPVERIGSLDAVASIGGIDVKGPLQDSEIRRGVDRVTGAFRACYRSAAHAASKTPALTVRLSFEIDETRAARGIGAGRTALPGLSSCLEDAAAKIRTRIAPDVGNARVTITVSFKPTDS